jgi:hypothetical protein
MDIFRTKLEIKEAKTKIDYSKKIMFLGSCFAENVGNIFIANKFNTLVNPFGIIYNPISVANSLNSIIDEKEFTQDDLILVNDKWASLFHHGKFSNTNKQDCIDRLNSNNSSARLFLEDTSSLVITFGTAWVYEYIEKEMVVSNCHKLPAKDFNRYRLSVDDIVDTYKELIVKLRYFNPNIKIIFTVSPIRHWKDGANGNQLSKSVLLLAIDELIENMPNIEYFPSYEIMMDELRDYRFYAEDMLHVSPVALNYIWERFKESNISSTALSAMKEINKLNKSIEHRPFSTNTQDYKDFLNNLLSKIDMLEKKYPNVNFSIERELISHRISSCND